MGTPPHSTKSSIKQLTIECVLGKWLSKRYKMSWMVKREERERELERIKNKKLFMTMTGGMIWSVFSAFC